MRTVAGGCPDLAYVCNRRQAYSSRANRNALRDKHIATIIPQSGTRAPTVNAKAATAAVQPAFDPAAYKLRNQVECGFNRRKHWRGLATRYDSARTCRPPSTSSKCSTGYAPSPTAMIRETEPSRHQQFKPGPNVKYP